MFDIGTILNDFQALKSELFRFGFHFLGSKILNIPEFNLSIDFQSEILALLPPKSAKTFHERLSGRKYLQTLKNSLRLLKFKEFSCVGGALPPKSTSLSSAKQITHAYVPLSAHEKFEQIIRITGGYHFIKQKVFDGALSWVGYE